MRWARWGLRRLADYAQAQTFAGGRSISNLYALQLEATGLREVIASGHCIEMALGSKAGATSVVRLVTNANLRAAFPKRLTYQKARPLLNCTESANAKQLSRLLPRCTGRATPLSHLLSSDFSHPPRTQTSITARQFGSRARPISEVRCKDDDTAPEFTSTSEEAGPLLPVVGSMGPVEADEPIPHHPYPMLPYLASSPPLDPVIKIFTVTSSPNYFQPWQNKPQREVTGSGFAIAGQRILTNAHVVANQTFVLVRKHGSSTKFRAEVEAVGHECDLALLRVKEPGFWEGVEPLSFGDIPKLQDAVAVVGYPQGGDNISLTGGVVSRVELMQYAHGAGHLLAVQIDAAINPGNSGGPALMDFRGMGVKSDWKVVGVAFQNLAGADNIGYIIPVPVIDHFLADVQDSGHYVGFCSLGLQCQAMENAQLRRAMSMQASTTGVLVNKVHKLADAASLVKKDDVLLAFDGVPIANDGSVHFRQRERISFDHLVAMKKAGEKGRLKVLREGKEMEFEIELQPVKALVPVHQYDKLPSYFIFAGLVFVPLTQPYLHEYGDDWYNTSPRRLCDMAMRAYPDYGDQQVVILSQVLLDDVNAGYQNLAELQVKRVNGVDVRNLRHLRELVESCSSKQLRIDLDDERVIVLDYESAKSASRDILRRHRIPSPISEDLEQAPESADGAASVEATIPHSGPQPEPAVSNRTLVY